MNNVSLYLYKIDIVRLFSSSFSSSFRTNNKHVTGILHSVDDSLLMIQFEKRSEANLAHNSFDNRTVGNIAYIQWANMVIAPNTLGFTYSTLDLNSLRVDSVKQALLKRLYEFNVYNIIPRKKEEKRKERKEGEKMKKMKRKEENKEEKEEDENSVSDEDLYFSGIDIFIPSEGGKVQLYGYIMIPTLTNRTQPKEVYLFFNYYI